MSVNDIDKYKKFLEEVLRPDYLKSIEDREILAKEVHEYEILLLSITKILESKMTSLKTRINLGHHVFVNAEVENCEKIIVKLMGDLYAELTLPRAIVFIEKRIELINKRIEAVEEMSSKIRAHIDVVLASIADFEKLL